MVGQGRMPLVTERGQLQTSKTICEAAKELGNCFGCQLVMARFYPREPGFISQQPELSPVDTARMIHTHRSH